MAYTINDLPKTEITEKVTSATDKFAHEFGNYLGSGGNKMTTNQLRRFFGEVKRQQMREFDEGQFVLLKPKLAYAVGRDKKRTKINEFYLFMADAIDAVHSQEQFNRFVQVFEAIVAYHKETAQD